MFRFWAKIVPHLGNYGQQSYYMLWHKWRKDQRFTRSQDEVIPHGIEKTRSLWQEIALSRRRPGPIPPLLGAAKAIGMACQRGTGSRRIGPGFRRGSV